MNIKQKSVRMAPAARKEQILNTAISLSIEKGYRYLTRRLIANRIHCASGLINHYFDDISTLKEVVIQTAIEKEILPILAENYVAWGKETADISSNLKNKIIQYLTN